MNGDNIQQFFQADDCEKARYHTYNYNTNQEHIKIEPNTLNQLINQAKGAKTEQNKSSANYVEQQMGMMVTFEEIMPSYAAVARGEKAMPITGAVPWQGPAQVTNERPIDFPRGENPRESHRGGNDWQRGQGQWQPSRRPPPRPWHKEPRANAHREGPQLTEMGKSRSQGTDYVVTQADVERLLGQIKIKEMAEERERKQTKRLSVNFIKMPEFPPGTPMDQALRQVTEHANAELKRAQVLINTAQRNCERLLDTLKEYNPKEALGEIPYLYIASRFGKEYPDALVVITPVGFAPPNQLYIYNTYYNPSTVESRYLAYKEKMTKRQLSFEVMHMTPYGTYVRIMNGDPWYIYPDAALKIRQDNPDLYASPSQVPKKYIWQNERNNVMKKNRPDLFNKKKEETEQAAEAMVAGQQQQPHQDKMVSSYIKDKQQKSQDQVRSYEGNGPDPAAVTEVYYEKRNNRNPNAPEWITMRMNMNRPLPHERYIRSTACKYYLVADQGRLEKYMEENRRRKEEKKQRTASNLHLQQIYYRNQYRNGLTNDQQTESHDEGHAQQRPKPHEESHRHQADESQFPPLQSKRGEDRNGRTSEQHRHHADESHFPPLQSQPANAHLTPIPESRGEQSFKAHEKKTDNRVPEANNSLNGHEENPITRRESRESVDSPTLSEDEELYAHDEEAWNKVNQPKRGRGRPKKSNMTASQTIMMAEQMMRKPAPHPIIGEAYAQLANLRYHD